MTDDAAVETGTTSMVSPATEPQDPWFAVALTSIFPGLNFFHSGNRGLGTATVTLAAALIVAAVVLLAVPSASMRASIVCFVAFVFLSLAMLPIAYYDARSHITAPSIDGERIKSAWLAIVLTRIFPGLGHLYLRWWVAGVVLLIAMIAIPAILAAMGVADFTGNFIGAAISVGALIMTWEAARPGVPRPRTLWVIVALIALAAIFPGVIRSLVIRAYRVPSESMLPGLAPGDCVMARIGQPIDPKRGDVVVLDYPQDPTKLFIKRVIGLPGDTIQIVNKVVVINGSRLIEPYAVHLDASVRPAGYDVRDNFGPIEVAPHQYFVLGDNRDNSNDSRHFGPIGTRLIRGTVYKRYWPWLRAGRVR